MELGLGWKSSSGKTL